MKNAFGITVNLKEMTTVQPSKLGRMIEILSQHLLAVNNVLSAYAEEKGTTLEKLDKTHVATIELQEKEERIKIVIRERKKNDKVPEVVTLINFPGLNNPTWPDIQWLKEN